MTQSLFRAIPPPSAATSAAHLRMPGSAALAVLLAATLVSAIAFTTTAGYARKQTTMGTLVPTAGAVRIATPRAGVLTEIAVTNGQSVEAGAPLFIVDFRQTTEGGRTLDATLIEALDRQEALLREQIRAEVARAANESDRLRSREEALELDATALSAQRQIVERRARAGEERVAAIEDLRRRRLISESEFRAREDAALELRQEVVSLDQRIVAARQEAVQVRLHRAQAIAESAERRARLESGIADLQHRRAEVIGQRALVVRAPIAGRVTALQASLGQRAEPAKPVLTLLPDGASLRAELFVPSRAIGFVRPGQDVRLMYEAFPYQRFGTHRGIVETVSETVLAPDEVQGPLRPNEPSYRVAVRLERQDLVAFGRSVPLQPDMGVRADIMLDQRTLLEWILEPLFSLRGRM